MASDLYKKWNNKEKKELCNLIFSELIVCDWCVAWYKAEKGFSDLLLRNDKKSSNSSLNKQKLPLSWNDDTTKWRSSIIKLRTFFINAPHYDLDQLLDLKYWDFWWYLWKEWKKFKKDK